jgi:UDP-N-acetylglucosamine--N-acetylmuramyl-(pentapeptide) pyrophosphoryl-undecaprenol N-acetylglucosamine transferase
MGGFVAGPGGLMAKLLGIPLVIHEQNRVPGTTNRLLARIANQVLEAFPKSFSDKVHAQCTGNPLRKPFLNLPGRAVKPSGQPLNILVVGGSQGAQILNEVVPEAMALLTNVAIIHQTGTVMAEQVRQHYQNLSVNADVQAFIEDMIAVYQWADLVICRAGAMTVSEVAACGIPAIFIPLPSAIDDHQTANARYLTDANAASILMQKDLNPQSLAEQITKISPQIMELGQSAKQCAWLDATETVVTICITEAKQ